MNIFLTGASKGIGKVIKNYFELNGHSVISPGRECLNLSDFNSVEDYLSTFNDDIDILINNAGINEVCDFKDITNEKFDLVYDTNFKNHFFITKFFLDKFVKKEFGRIVNIGSARTEIIKPKRFLYSLSKSSFDMMTKYVTLEYSKYNILCNIISPGYVECGMLHRSNNPKDILKLQESIPVKKMCNPEEIAKLCYFLTITNNYITGQNIFIDGGLSTCKNELELQ